MEVPEIFDGTVKIRACVREPGERAKVAVESTHKDIDPIGACVGMKGTRVQAVIRELRGEKIDIIEWDDDPVALVKAALQPAQVSRVQVVDTEQKIMEVVVEDKQLSLAIGKRGQNVRLAAKLVGWRIEIKSEEEKRLEVAAQLSEFKTMEGVDKDIVQRLMDARVQGLDHLLQMTDEEFASIDIDEATAESPAPGRRRGPAQGRDARNRPPTAEPAAEEPRPEAEATRPSRPARRNRLVFLAPRSVVDPPDLRTLHTSRNRSIRASCPNPASTNSPANSVSPPRRSSRS